VSAASSSAKTSSDLSKAAIIPKPVSITATGEFFRLKSHANICISEESKELRQIGQYLADKLKDLPVMDFRLKPRQKLRNQEISI